jgi:beta-lactamase superfamily II metal-dependent hydrolase
MAAPTSGVRVRMYRQGHGDCFLLAFPGGDGNPFYMLIDCGMKKGSALMHSIRQVAENIRAATGSHLHLVAITHEHEDHVSGFLSERKVFDSLSVDKLWLAWTEDPDHDLANQLRAKYKDTLLGLLGAFRRLAAAAQLAGAESTDRPSARAHRVVDALLEFEAADTDRALPVADLEAKVKGRTNKEGILVVKRRAELNQGTEYLRPHTKPLTLPSVPGVRVFVLGPPENEPSLRDMDPKGDEEFHFAAAEERSFLAAFSDSPAVQEAHQPFEARHRIPAAAAGAQPFFAGRYYAAKSPENDDQAWRRIDGDWLRSSETFALRMNNFINNTSLVLAIELPKTKKVLLFVGDAQRGNWVSWHEKKWTAENGLAAGGEVTCADLLGRTVFYKVGHHGSHNATMKQKGLQDMATGPFADQFVAMIPANEAWATTANDPPWLHPLKAIYQALLKKAKGRVFVLDRDLPKPPAQVLSTADWKSFLARTTTNDLYYEFTVED